MINVYPIKGGYIKGFMVVGHAENSEHGTDIVCASVSAITQTTVLGLEMFASITKEVKDGFMLVEISKLNIQAYALTESMVAGLRQIAVQYPKNLQVWKDDSIDGEVTRVSGSDRGAQTAREDGISTRTVHLITPNNNEA